MTTATQLQVSNPITPVGTERIAGDLASGVTGGMLSQAIADLFKGTKGTDVASAATTPIGAATGMYVHVTGVAAITAFDNVAAGILRFMTFTGVLVLTYNAATLILPTAANITTAAGDCAIFESEGAGNWRCVGYQRADGTALKAVSLAPNVQSIVSAATVTPTFTNDLVEVTAQAAALTLANPTGTALEGWGIVLRIKDDGTARAITYGAQYRATGTTLPVITVIGKTLYIAMVFNNTDTKWDVLAAGVEGSDALVTETAARIANDATTLASANTYSDGLVVGLLDDRGNFDASGNVFPSTGGSGPAGAIKKGDLWTISVAGTLGGVAVAIGDVVRARIDAPATSADWVITEHDFGYVAENSANKVTSLSGASTDTQYPSAKLAYDQLALKAPIIGPYFTTQIGVGAAANVADRILASGTTDGATLAPVGFLASETVNAFATSYAALKTSSTVSTGTTLTDAMGVWITPMTLQGTAAITNRYGLRIDDLTAGTNTYGAYLGVSSGANKWNLYASGTANNYLAGHLQLGTLTTGTASLYIGNNITGSSIQSGIQQIGVVQSDVTSSANYNFTQISTAAAAFNCATIYANRVEQGTIGAGSTVTSQIAYGVVANMVGATNNYGFYSLLPSGATNWHFYGSGTASSYFNGSIGLGSIALTGYRIRNQLAITGAVASYAFSSEGVVQSDVTTAALYFRTSASTLAANFVLPSLRHFYASQSTIGAGSTVQSQYGFWAESTLIGATNNYGYYGNLAVEPGSPTTFTQRTITNVSVTTNVVSITTSVANAYTVGQMVTVAAGTNTQLNGTFAVTGAGNPYTYALVTPDVASVADTGTTSPQRRYNIYCSGTANNYLGGPLGLSVTAPTASMHIKAGTATANTAPLKFNSGTLLTTAEAGAIEFLTDKFYATITTGAARKEFAMWDNPATLGVHLKMTEGSGGFCGQVALTAGVATVTITGVTTASRAFVQLVTPAGTLGAAVKAVCTANTLTITSETAAIATQTLDTSTFNYFIVS